MEPLGIRKCGKDLGFRGKLLDFPYGFLSVGILRGCRDMWGLWRPRRGPALSNTCKDMTREDCD